MADDSEVYFKDYHIGNNVLTTFSAKIKGKDFKKYVIRSEHINDANGGQTVPVKLWLEIDDQVEKFLLKDG